MPMTTRKTRGRFGAGGGWPAHRDEDDLTLSQAARLAGRSVGTLRHTIAVGRLPARRESNAASANLGKEIIVVRRPDVLALCPPLDDDHDDLTTRLRVLEGEVEDLRAEVEDVRRVLLAHLSRAD